jgi:hypothetical protein
LSTQLDPCRNSRSTTDFATSNPNPVMYIAWFSNALRTPPLTAPSGWVAAHCPTPLPPSSECVAVPCPPPIPPLHKGGTIACACITFPTLQRGGQGRCGPTAEGRAGQDEPACFAYRRGGVLRQGLRVYATRTRFALVYRCWNFAGKVSLSLTFADPRRAFQTAMLTRHVVAATGDRA